MLTLWTTGTSFVITKKVRDPFPGAGNEPRLGANAPCMRVEQLR